MSTAPPVEIKVGPYHSGSQNNFSSDFQKTIFKIHLSTYQNHQPSLDISSAELSSTTNHPNISEQSAIWGKTPRSYWTKAPARKFKEDTLEMEYSWPRNGKIILYLTRNSKVMLASNPIMDLPPT